MVSLNTHIVLHYTNSKQAGPEKQICAFLSSPSSLSPSSPYALCPCLPVIRLPVISLYAHILTSPPTVHALLMIKSLFRQSTLAQIPSEKIDALGAEAMAKEVHDPKQQAFYLKLYVKGGKAEPTKFGSRVTAEIEKKSFWIEHISDDQKIHRSTFMSKLVHIQKDGRLKGWWNVVDDSRYIVYSRVGGGEE